jgi:hypothetical protein
MMEMRKALRFATITEVATWTNQAEFRGLLTPGFGQFGQKRGHCFSGGLLAFHDGQMSIIEVGWAYVAGVGTYDDIRIPEFMLFYGIAHDGVGLQQLA